MYTCPQHYYETTGQYRSDLNNNYYDISHAHVNVIFPAGLIEHSVSCSALMSRELSREGGDVKLTDTANTAELQNTKNNSNEPNNGSSGDRINKMEYTIIEGEGYPRDTVKGEG